MARKTKPAPALHTSPDRRQPTAQKLAKQPEQKTVMATTQRKQHLANAHGWLLTYAPAGIVVTVTMHHYGILIDTKDMTVEQARTHYERNLKHEANGFEAIKPL